MMIAIGFDDFGKMLSCGWMANFDNLFFISIKKPYFFLMPVFLLNFGKIFF